MAGFDELISWVKGEKMEKVRCPLCNHQAKHFVDVEAVNYFTCDRCDFIFADPTLLDRMDGGEPPCQYEDEYWKQELAAARDRSYGSSLARVAEALHYCTLPVNRFVDIGTGPGYLLDSLASYLPASANTFYGVEKFPPPAEYRSTHPNYVVSDLKDVDTKFECGVCIEVLEHLTPNMAASLAKAMARVSVPGSLYLFNTGLTDYVRKEDPSYLDPHRRGHITSWSVAAARVVFGKEGFSVHALPGKTWAFIVEMLPLPHGANTHVRDRIWSALPRNIQILVDPARGDVMRILGLESARAY